MTCLEEFDGDEGQLRRFMETLGRKSRAAQYRFLARLPGIEAEGLHRRWGYQSIHEYAAKVACLEKSKVERVRKLHGRIGSYRSLWAFLEAGKELSKLEVLAPHVQNHEDARRFETWLARGHSKRVLEEWVAGLPTAKKRLDGPDRSGSGNHDARGESPSASGEGARTGDEDASAESVKPGPDVSPDPQAGADPAPRPGPPHGDEGDGAPDPGGLFASDHDAEEEHDPSTDPRPQAADPILLRLSLTPLEERNLRRLQALLASRRGEACSLGRLVGELVEEKLARLLAEDEVPDRRARSDTSPPPAAGNLEAPRDPGESVEPTSSSPIDTRLRPPSCSREKPEIRLQDNVSSDGLPGLPGVSTRSHRKVSTRRLPYVLVVYRPEDGGPAWTRSLRGPVVVEPGEFLDRPLDAAPAALGELRQQALEAAARAGPGGPLPAEIQRYVALRCGGHCELPGCHAFAVAIHHRDPRAEGGDHHPDALVACCALHHEEAHADPDASWAHAAFLEYRRQHRDPTRDQESEEEVVPAAAA